jgi:hypothetical protein
MNLFDDASTVRFYLFEFFLGEHQVPFTVFGEVFLPVAR